MSADVGVLRWDDRIHRRVEHAVRDELRDARSLFERAGEADEGPLSQRRVPRLVETEQLVAPFERWVREKGAAASGRLGLVVSNPPYGIRGARHRRRSGSGLPRKGGLDLLAPDGLGVFLVPGGFLTSRTAQFVALHEKVLKRHHLAAAYRLPSINEKRREAIFPGAMLVTDLLFFRARGSRYSAGK